MKLRKVGNSLGLTFTRDVLSRAGLQEGQELKIIANPGSITIQPMHESVIVELSEMEVVALISGDLKSEEGKSAIENLAVQFNAFKQNYEK